SLEMMIFNRWGEKLATLFSLSEQWDGRKNGQSVPEGVYTYRLKAVLNSGETVDRGGTVTLIR
ncbi:MAG: gliding motility-associated C-terminal domain-containing protein, partial [Bacteroidota bacterium]